MDHKIYNEFTKLWEVKNNNLEMNRNSSTKIANKENMTRIYGALEKILIVLLLLFFFF